MTSSARSRAIIRLSFATLPKIMPLVTVAIDEAIDVLEVHLRHDTPFPQSWQLINSVRRAAACCAARSMRLWPELVSIEFKYLFLLIVQLRLLRRRRLQRYAITKIISTFLGHDGREQFSKFEQRRFGLSSGSTTSVCVFCWSGLPTFATSTRQRVRRAAACQNKLKRARRPFLRSDQCLPRAIEAPS
jgi:hypothetical protein